MADETFSGSILIGMALIIHAPIRLTLKDAVFYTAAGELELVDIASTETVWWFSHDILDDIAIAVRETLLYGGEGNGT